MSKKIIKIITFIVFLIGLIMIGYNANSQDKKIMSVYKYSAVDTTFLDKWTPIKIQHNFFYISKKHVIQELNGYLYIYVIDNIDNDNKILAYKDNDWFIFYFRNKQCISVQKDKKITYIK